MTVNAQKKSDKRSRLVNILVILICLLGSVYFVIMFGLDRRTLDSVNEKPLGTIIAGDNVVQRRKGNRALWDRVTSDSSVYSGDEIRTADISNATLSIEGNTVDLNEKTVIRLHRSPEDGGSVLISLDEGNLVITTASGGGNIAINLMGRIVETGPLTVLSASVGKDGAVVQVSEGSATLVEGGRRREISSGKMIALDHDGAGQVIEIPEHSELVPPELVLPELVPKPPEPAPHLPAPLNRQPPGGHRIGIEQLKETSGLVFTWSAVEGADAYIFTLYQDTLGVRRQIIRVPPGNRRNWTLENLSALGSGTFVWQVEAVGMSPAGTIERRGRIGENSFVIDIPQPLRVQIEDSETLYDN